MKFIFTILFTITAFFANAQQGKASTIKKTFNRSTSVSILINADATKIWNLLANSENHVQWNTTVISIEGTITQGEKIKLTSTLDSSRTFKLKVKEVIPNQKLVWGDAMGTRVYLLTPTENGVLFSIDEKIGGLMFPLFANKIPSFDASFEQNALDLKNAAEAK